MGMSFSEAKRIIRFETDGLLPPQAMIAELGSQEFSNSLSRDQVADLLQAGNRQTSADSVGDVQYASKLYSALGYSSISFDLVDAPLTRRLDLNTDLVPDEYRGSANLTTNFGTTEHILNQFNCFRFVHDITRPGGLMWHALPSSDYYGHGFFKYDPGFFFALARANDYKIVDWSLSPSVKVDHWDIPEYLFDAGMPRIKSRAGSVTFILQKRFDQPFAPPIDSPAPIVDRALFYIQKTRPTGRLFIYGAGGMGQSLVALLQKNEFPVSGFIDTYKSGECCGLPIHRFEDYRPQAQSDDRIVIASDFAAEIKTLLSENNLGWFFAVGGI